MPTDDERREVARRLRHAWTNVPDRDPVRHQLRVLLEVYEAVGLDDGESDAIDLFGRLADLIEPSCDRDALLALADDMQWSVDHHDGIRSIMRDFKRGKLSEDKIVEMLVLGWEKDAKTIREAVGA